LGRYWAVDALHTAGAHVHLAHPLGVKGFAYRRVKNDVRDAADLADLLRMHRLPEAYIATPHERELRELVRHRAKLVALRSGLKAQVHATLAKQGQLPASSDVFGRAGKAWLRSAPLDLVYRQRIDSLLELIDAYDGEVECFRAMVANRLAGHRGYRVIQQISGIGPTFAAVFVAEIGDINRFCRPEKLCCWAGLTRAIASRTPPCIVGRSRNRARSWCAGPRSKPASTPEPGPSCRPTGPGSSPPAAATSASSLPPADCSPWSSTACATAKSARSPHGPGEWVRTRQGAWSCCVMTPTSSSAWSPA
jgi:transposase/transposase IS116/IS110/IS902 family protein